MSDFVFCELDHRMMISITGEDRAGFLQNIITNDINKASVNNCIYALLLAPQGKFLFDFFILDDGKEGFAVDIQKSQLDALIKKLALYRLRAKVDFEPKNNLKIWMIWNRDESHENFSGKNIFRDPRHPNLGWRMISADPPENIQRASVEDYARHRISLGICEAGIELTQQCFALECNLDQLNAIDFNKGCYVGQEVTSRMKHRANGGRKRMAVISSKTALPPAGAKIIADDQTIGNLLSAQGDLGLAIIRRDRLTGSAPLIDGRSVRIRFMLSS